MKQSYKIIVTNLSKTFGTKNVLHGVNLSITEGESLVIIGGSGSGKSVLLKCIVGLLDPDPGSAVLINNNNYTHIHISRRLDNDTTIGVLFQGNALFDSINIWQNIVFGIAQKYRISEFEARRIASEKLEMVELPQNIMDLYPVEISGGMQKRVALARTIAHNPKLIFFDEPTSGLDPVTSNKISVLIRNIATTIHATTITITHDVRCMKRIADSVAVIANHGIIWHSKLDDLYNTDNSYIRDFLGNT